MKIKYALTACDNNPLYYEFWPSVSKIWQEFFKIEPILIYVGEELPKELEDNKYGQIIKFKPSDKLPTATQSQFIRLWYAKEFKDDIIITTDIDMYPLSKHYFIYQLRNISDEKFVFLRFSQNWNYNICYNIGKGNIFNEILELDEDFEELALKQYNKCKLVKREWFTDEEYLAEKLNNYKGDKYIELLRDKPNRIDRAFWTFNPGFVALGFYYDCHSLRPYSQYKKQIDQLIENLI